MSTLTEIEAAADALRPEEKIKLIRFLTARLPATEGRGRGARLVEGPEGTLLLQAPPGAPPMSTETVRRMLEDFP
ncbi:MAG: hypothetical protein ACR2IV_13940 [Bryobacteraceae bacterium]